MATQEKVTQIKRLAKISEVIERRIEIKEGFKANLLRKIAHKQKFISKICSKPAREIKLMQIFYLKEEVKFCDQQISKLRMQIVSNQEICKIKMLKMAFENETIDTLPSSLNLKENYRFDWTTLLRCRN